MSGPLVVRFNGMTLDTGRRLVLHCDRELHLTRKAFDLLTVLVCEAPQVVSKDELHRRLWPDTFVSDATLAGVVKELRRVLGEQSDGVPVIRTVHGVGYALGAIVEAEASADSESGRCWLVSGERRLRLANGVNEIGRDPGVAITIEASEASRRHARITLVGTVASLEDLDSKNGTLLNERLLSQPTVLIDGDVIRIGSAVLVFRVVWPLASTATADLSGGHA